MDTLMNWFFGKGRHLDVTNSPYCFNAVAIIKNEAGKITGARFECSSLSAIVDIPLHVLQKSLFNTDDPVDDADMCRNFLSESKLSRSWAVVSPYNVYNCTINLSGVPKDTNLPSIPFTDGFVPKDKNDGYKGLTSFILPNMVIRIPLLTSTADNLEAMNYILYKTEFFQTFGIAEVDKFEFIENLQVRCKMRSYKLEDPKFKEAFSFLANEFCYKYKLPKNCITCDNVFVNISFGLGYGRSDNMDAMKYPTSEIPMLFGLTDVEGEHFGLAEELGYSFSIYHIPDKKTGEILNTSRFFKHGLATGRLVDQAAAHEDISIKDKDKVPAFLRKFYRIDKSTFLVLLPQLPRLKKGMVSDIVSLMDEAIYSNINSDLLEDCLEWMHPIELAISYSGLASKKVIVTRALDITDDSFGEDNSTELINIIGRNFVDFLDSNRIGGYCTAEGKTLFFTTKHEYVFFD